MTDKRLAEYVGVCWHENRKHIEPTFTDRCHSWVCVDCGRLLTMSETEPEEMICTPDFTTPDGWQLVLDKVSENEKVDERDGWFSFYEWLYQRSDKQQNVCALGCQFHENPNLSEKSALFIEWLEEKDSE